MSPETRSKYAEYIAGAIRFATKETGLQWPDGTIIVTKSYGELAELDEILGWKIYAMDMPSDREFFVAFPSGNCNEYRLQKSFIEYTEIYSIGDSSDNC